MVFKIHPTIVGIRFVVNLRSPSGSYNIRGVVRLPQFDVKTLGVASYSARFKEDLSILRSILHVRALALQLLESDPVTGPDWRASFVELDYPVR